METWIFSAKAMKEFLGVSRMQWQDLHTKGLIVNDGRQRVMFYETYKNYIRHLKQHEDIAEKNLERLDSQTAFNRQRTKREAVTTEQLLANLIPIEAAAAEFDYLEKMDRKLLEDVIAEAVKKVPKNSRAKLESELTQQMNDQLADRAARINKKILNKQQEA